MRWAYWFWKLGNKEPAPNNFDCKQCGIRKRSIFCAKCLSHVNHYPRVPFHLFLLLRHRHHHGISLPSTVKRLFCRHTVFLIPGKMDKKLFIDKKQFNQVNYSKQTLCLMVDQDESCWPMTSTKCCNCCTNSFQLKQPEIFSGCWKFMLIQV